MRNQTPIFRGAECIDRCDGTPESYYRRGLLDRQELRRVDLEKQHGQSVVVRTKFRKTAKRMTIFSDYFLES